MLKGRRISQENTRSEFRRHRESYRPWGRCDVVVNEERFNVNRITVKPGGMFSLQMHHHRAEHWVVLSGTAKVTLDDTTYLITENQSTFIPIGSVHMLENPGKIPLELLEVQSGSYLGEDDIIRIKDHYGLFKIRGNETMTTLTCFKAYDIRGKLGEELNEDIAYRIGRAYGEFLKPKLWLWVVMYA